MLVKGGPGETRSQVINSTVQIDEPHPPTHDKDLNCYSRTRRHVVNETVQNKIYYISSDSSLSFQTSCPKLFYFCGNDLTTMTPFRSRSTHFLCSDPNLHPVLLKLCRAFGRWCVHGDKSGALWKCYGTVFQLLWWHFCCQIKDSLWRWCKRCWCAPHQRCINAKSKHYNKVNVIQ